MAQAGRFGNKNIRKVALAGLFLALCLVLPLLVGQIPQIGQALSPMHIPVFLCGFVCGWPYGLAVGFIAPLLKSLVSGGIPPFFPGALSMAFEMAVYGFVSGFLYSRLPKKMWVLVLELLAAMLAGRLVWGAARYIMAGLSGSDFGMEMFLTGAFVTALPGIVLHLALVPLVVWLLRRAKLLE